MSGGFDPERLSVPSWYDPWPRDVITEDLVLARRDSNESGRSAPRSSLTGSDAA